MNTSHFLRTMPAVMIFCLFSLQLHSQIPVAVNDTVDITPGFPVTVDLLANDTVTPGDSIRIVFGSPPQVYIKSIKNADNTITFLLDRWGYGGLRAGGYQIFDITLGAVSQPAEVVFNIHDNSSNFLDVNNVKALFSATGSHFFLDSAQYEVPKGSGKMSMFLNNVWIGGLDPGNTLHFAGEQYRQGPNMGSAGSKRDYWAGPVSDTSGYNLVQDTIWNRVWKLNKTEIDYHRAHYWEPGYVAPRDILEWPAHGDTTLGQAPGLAPFSDRNTNGKYEPYDGDYPEIRGDQALFFIYNDDHGYHAESTGEKLRVEVHAMAYAFDRPDDTAFKNTTFLHLKFYNRSNNSYSDTWMGVFTDIDLGYANDDYVGCDPERGMYFGYNGTPVDGTGQPYAYGENPPVQAVVILGGPLMDPDGYDNPAFRGSSLNGPSFKGSCDIVAQNGTLQTMKYGPGEIYEDTFLVRSEAINGIHYGDGTADNERLGLRRFLQSNNSNSGFPNYMTAPLIAPDHYKMMKGFWKDNSRMVYGGNGHLTTGGYGPECDFMYPGLSDTCNWGTNGQVPNGPKEWTEKTAQNNPQDRRGTGSTGPFTFLPGTTQELDLAFAWARCYGTPDSSCLMNKINSVVDTIRKSFIFNSLPGGGLFYGINGPDGSRVKSWSVYPNPADRQVTVRCNQGYSGTSEIEIRNMQGVVVSRIIFNRAEGGCREEVISTASLPAGIYLLTISSEGQRMSQKLVISR